MEKKETFEGSDVGPNRASRAKTHSFLYIGTMNASSSYINTLQPKLQREMLDDKIVIIMLVGMLVVGGGKVLIQFVKHPSQENALEADEKTKEIVDDGPNYDITGKVTEVIDGDTIDIRVIEVDGIGKGVRIGKEETVRLGGGLNAPEFYENGYVKSRNFLRGLLPQGSTIYLDLDDLAVSKTGRPYRDLTSSERLVAVVYAMVDNRRVNVNAEVLRWGEKTFPDWDWLAYRDIASEFDPYKWFKKD